MALGSDRAANFVIKAKDAATGPLGKIGGAMGKLKSSAGAAFRAIAAGAIAAGAAIAGLVVSSIKGAVEEERNIIRLNAALKARGFALDELQPKIEAQIVALRRFGISDDEVRKSLEIGSRFFKDQNKLLQANASAANIAALGEKSLSDVMMIFGKAAQGQTRGLKALGIEVEKGAKLKDILAAADAKYAGIAEEVANSVGGKFAAAQETFNEQMDNLGARFLPVVSDGLDFLAKEVLPRTDELFKKLGDTIFDFGSKLTEKGGVVDSVNQVVGPIGEKLNVKLGETGEKIGTLLGKLGELAAALWDDGEGPLALAVSFIGGAFELLLNTINLIIDAVTLVIDLAKEALSLLDSLGGKARDQAAFPSFTGGGGLYGNGGSSGGMSPYPTGGFTGQATVAFGRDATSSFNAYLGTQSTTTGATRTDGRP